ncbi:odorant receptor 22c [Monomorium pharaonis]|uniref:odorant receptor 22c n=1 Tax=Monomorium pharaonis TaxID=307658 RepID=UPI00063FB11D|nr:odorant receptor 22c [Monomorium pharaonis]XP_028048885.1 odorant receptor 22c [Monomorium pharaonis]
MKRMDFESMNLLNSRVNVLSGNLLPIAGNNSQFSVICRVHSIFVWLTQIILTIALISGFILTPKEKALKDGMVCIVVLIEASFMLSRFYSRQTLIREMIEKMNNILQNADEIMADIAKAAIKPIIMPFTIYGVTSGLSITIWTIQPVLLVFEKSTFFYVDYNLPTAFTTEPFSSRVLIFSTIIMTLGSVYLFLKKFGVDVYMMHLVLMLTAQYRYTAAKLMILFQDLQNSSHDKSQDKRHLVEDQWIEKELKKICQHQNTILHMSFILKKLLSVNFSLLYINNVFRFCFIGILLISIPSLSLAEGISVMSFATGSLMQFFLLCYSVQTLSDASTKITDKAFDEGWYQFGSPTKRTFLLLIMANNLECKIAAIGKFNLSLPSFMTIMNQSYSIALLVLRAK